MKDDNKKGCLVAVIAIAFIPVAIALYAEAALLNWNWFATTIGAPRIGFLQAYGLALVVSAFDHKRAETSSAKGDPADGVAKLIGGAVGRFVMLVLVGWAVHAWMVSR